MQISASIIVNIASIAGADANVQNLGNVESGKGVELHPVEKLSIFGVSPFSASVKGRAPSSFAFIADPSISLFMAFNSE